MFGPHAQPSHTPWFLTGPWELSQNAGAWPHAANHVPRSLLRRRIPAYDLAGCLHSHGELLLSGRNGLKGDITSPPCLPVLSSLSASSFSYPSTCFCSPASLPGYCLGLITPQEESVNPQPPGIGVLSPQLRASQRLHLSLGSPGPASHCRPFSFHLRG